MLFPPLFLEAKVDIALLDQRVCSGRYLGLMTGPFHGTVGVKLSVILDKLAYSAHWSPCVNRIQQPLALALVPVHRTQWDPWECSATGTRLEQFNGNENMVLMYMGAWAGLGSALMPCNVSLSVSALGLSICCSFRAIKPISPELTPAGRPWLYL